VLYLALWPRLGHLVDGEPAAGTLPFIRMAVWRKFALSWFTCLCFRALRPSAAIPLPMLYPPPFSPPSTSCLLACALFANLHHSFLPLY
jgi:hypothetical protein